MRISIPIYLFLILNQFIFAGDQITNSDIVITDYNMILMEQGKSRVYPIFKVKNEGNKRYNNVRLYYERPSGISDSGENVLIDWHKEYGWKYDHNNLSVFTLEPNQEITFNPSKGSNMYLKASTSQAITTYSTKYYFKFTDEDGHQYQTPSQLISNFIKVIEHNDDIVITDYNMILMEQGKSRVYPIFKVKNKGNKRYNNVSLYYERPSGISDSGENVLIDWHKEYGWKYDHNNLSAFTLEPNQEITFNPSKGSNMYLKASTSQAITTYSTKYYFKFTDEDGHYYQTPSKTINDFIVVVKLGESPPTNQLFCPADSQENYEGNDNEGGYEKFTLDGHDTQTGSEVHFTVKGFTGPDVISELEIQINALDYTPLDRFSGGHLDVYFDTGIIQIAVPDDKIKVYYENISMEYEKDGQWYPFVNYVGDDPSTTMKWIGYIIELNPKVALTKKVIEGLALLEESFASGEGVKGPLSSVFYNENDFDIVHINWDAPIVENLPYFPSIVEDIGNRRDPDKRKWKHRVIEKLRFKIPIVSSESVHKNEITAYLLYKESVSTNLFLGQPESPLTVDRELELHPK